MSASWKVFDAVTSDPRFRLRIFFGDSLTFGPGKADLLMHIAAEGSISAAGRRMGMSYKRAWLLVEEMNAAFQTPLVASARGGAKGGGAHLTEAGQQALQAFRRLEALIPIAGAAEMATLQGMLRGADMSEGK